MIKSEVIFLFDEDLRIGRNTNYNELTINDFNIDLRSSHLETLILYVNDKGVSKILKNRYGNDGLVVNEESLKIKNRINDIEIIDINVNEHGNVKALLSYCDKSNLGDINGGYDIMDVPVNIRELKYSERGNLLVNQSNNDSQLSVNSN